MGSEVDYKVPLTAAHRLAALMAEVGDGRWATTTTTVEDITGRPPRSLTRFLAEHATAFLP